MNFYQTFLGIYLFMLIVNGMILVVDSQLDAISIVPGSPFSGDDVEGETAPGIYDPDDPDAGLVGGITGQVTNGTNTFSPFVDTILYPITIIQLFIGVITGGFIFDVLGMIGFPEIFQTVMQGIIGFLLAICIIHYVTGRG